MNSSPSRLKGRGGSKQNVRSLSGFWPPLMGDYIQDDSRKIQTSANFWLPLEWTEQRKDFKELFALTSHWREEGSKEKLSKAQIWWTGFWLRGRLHKIKISICCLLNSPSFSWTNYTHTIPAHPARCVVEQLSQIKRVRKVLMYIRILLIGGTLKHDTFCDLVVNVTWWLPKVKTLSHWPNYCTMLNDFDLFLGLVWRHFECCVLEVAENLADVAAIPRINPTINNKICLSGLGVNLKPSWKTKSMHLVEVLMVRRRVGKRGEGREKQC